MAIEIVDLPTNSMVIFHSFLHSYVNVYQRVPPNPYENGLMTISQDCSKSAHKTVENNIWTHLGHRTCCWNRFNPRAFVKWGFQFFSTSDQISLKKILLRGIFGVLKKKRGSAIFHGEPPPFMAPIHAPTGASATCPCICCSCSCDSRRRCAWETAKNWQPVTAS